MRFSEFGSTKNLEGLDETSRHGGYHNTTAPTISVEEQADRFINSLPDNLYPMEINKDDNNTLALTMKNGDVVVFRDGAIDALENPFYRGDIRALISVNNQRASTSFLRELLDKKLYLEILKEIENSL